MSDQDVSLRDIRRPITKKVRFLDITDIKPKTKKKQFKNNTFKFIDEINNLKQLYKNKYFGDKKFVEKEKQNLDTIFEKFNIYNYLDINVKESLIQMLIKKQKGKLINELENQMLLNLDSNIIYVKRDMDPSFKDGKEIFGYKIVKGENKIV